MQEFVIKAESVDDAIKQFISEKKALSKEYEYHVKNEASNGFLNIFGSKQAKVKFVLPDFEDRILFYLKELLMRLKIEYSEITKKIEGNNYYFDIVDAKEAGFLIGKEGQFLESLQLLVNRRANIIGDKVRVFLDVEDYRKRKERRFMDNLKKMVNKTKKTHKPVTMRPMNSANRRIVHQYVKNDKSLRTMTVGRGSQRRVVIMPSNYNKNKIRRNKR